MRTMSSRVLLRALALLLTTVLCDRTAAAEEKVERPTWLFGTWTFENAEGTGTFEFQTNGHCRLVAKAKDAGEAQLDATWHVEGDTLVLELQGEAVRSRIERLPDERGRPRAKFVMPGQSGVVYTRVSAPDPATWLLGTWTRIDGAKDRMLIQPGGPLRVTAKDAEGKRVVSWARWSLENDLLTFRMQEKGEERTLALEVALLADVDGEVRAQFHEKGSKYPPEVFRKHPQRDATVRYEGPLVGRWDSVDDAVPTAFVFFATGRYERWRVFATVPLDVQRGAFAAVKSAVGEVLQLSPDGGPRVERGIELPGSDILRLTDASTGRTTTFRKQAGSEGKVSERSLLIEMSYPDAVASAEEDLAPVRIDPKLLETSPDLAPARDALPADPRPKDVHAGLFGLPHAEMWESASEDALVVDQATGTRIDAGLPDARTRSRGGPAMPRSVTRVWLYPHGRMALEVHVAKEGERPSPLVQGTRRWGKYEVTGSTVLVTYDDGSEERMRLVDGGLLLERDGITFWSLHWILAVTPRDK